MRCATDVHCGRVSVCGILSCVPVCGKCDVYGRIMEGISMPNQLKKNDRIPLKITGVTAEGSGVGHDNGLAVFVANAALGDTVTAHIIKVKKNYAVARIHQIVTPSPDRVKPDCPVFQQCGAALGGISHMKRSAASRRKRWRTRSRALGILRLRPSRFSQRGKRMATVIRHSFLLRIGARAENRLFCAAQPPDCGLPCMPAPAAGV